MRFTYLKETLKAAVLAMTVLLAAAGVSQAQTVNLTASQQTTTTPDGNIIPMWGWTCTGVTQGTTAGTSCTALTYNVATGALNAQTGGTTWQPPLIIVPYTATAAGSTTNLTINLTNALPVETSIMILGQAGGGLGAATFGSGPGGTFGPVREAAPRADGAHAGQTATTWTIVAGATFTPAAQGNRTRSMVPEVAGVATFGATPVVGTYTWTGLKPGTYLIRTGTYPSIQGPMGLYGVLVVTQVPASGAAGIAYPAASGAAGPANAVTYDTDVVALESEIDARQNRMVQALFPATGTAGASTANAGFDETAKWNLQCGAGPNGLTPSGTAPTCYPPAVDYTPMYFLFNGVAFSKDNRTASALPVPAAGATGNVLIRFVNAGSHMHTPSVNGLNMLLVAEDANVLPDAALAIAAPQNKTLFAKNPNQTAPATAASGLQLRTEVFQAAGKVMDVIVSPLQTGTNYNAGTYVIYDRALEALTTNGARDGGMQVVLDVADSGGATLAAANSTASVTGASYFCAPGVTLSVLDPGKGVAAKDVNVYGVTLVGNPPNNTLALANGGSVTLNLNGTFVYTPPAAPAVCTTSFSYYANANTGLTASATITQSTQAGPTAHPDSYTASAASTLRVAAPGVLGNDVDPSGYPMTAVNALVTGGTFSVQLNPDGSFTATKAASTACPAAGCTFTYQAKNSQNTPSNTTQVTLSFPTPSGLTVRVQDALTKQAITDYKWIIEQDLTIAIDPACQVNTGTGARPTGSNGLPCPALPAGSIVPPTPATQFHTSYMPIIAEGCTGPQSCERGQTVYDAGTPCTSPGVPAGCSATAGQHVAAACDGYGVCTVGATQLPATLPSEAHLAALNPDGTPATYYISILPGDSSNAFAYANVSDPTVAGNCSLAPGQTEPTGLTTTSTCSHTIGGAPVPAGTCTGTGTAYNCTYTVPTGSTANVTVNLQPAPIKTATVTAFIFEDDYPLNGEPDTGGGVDALATLEKPLGDFQIILWDTYGGIGDFTGQMHHDMFNMPLTNALNGTIDPATGLDACPISNTGGVAVGVIITCPQYESDGKTPSPLTGQVVVKNLMQGKFSIIAHPGAAREAAGEEWLQTNTLDGGHFLDSFIRSGEPPYFQEFGPGGWHVFIGFANPAHINARLAAICGGTTTVGVPFSTPCRNNLNGQVTNLHQGRSPDENLYGGNVFSFGDPGNYSPLSYTTCYAAIGDTDGMTIALAKCDADGNFHFTNLPDGDYGIVIFDQWDDYIVDGSSHQVSLNAAHSNSGQTLNVTYPSFTWQTHLWSRAYIDVNGQGRPNLDAQGNLDLATSPGLIQIPTRVRQTNGKFVNTLLSDIGGNSHFDETFPLFAWYTVETDDTRFRATGIHVVNDAGGQVDGPTPVGNGITGSAQTQPYQGVLNSIETFSLPAGLRVPGAVYCARGHALCDNTTATGSSATPGTCTPASNSGCISTGRIDPGSVDVEGWQGGVSQFNMIDWGKMPYYMPPSGGTGENGGIRGHVVNATTRPFDDPRMLFQNLWEPLVPNVTVNLYREGTAPDGTTTSLTLVDTTTTSSWDSWAQGFGARGRAAGTPNMSCTGQDTADPFFSYTMAGTTNYLAPNVPLPNNAQYKCYDGYHNLNQIQPATYDGLYRFPSQQCLTGTTFTVAGNPTSYTCATIANPAFGVAGQTGAAPKILPPGTYVTEVVLPPGWQLSKEEDLNLLIGDQYIAPAVQQFTGLGAIFITPDQASIDAANPSYTGPYTSAADYTPPWSCTTPTSCTLTPNTTNNGKQSTDYGRATFGGFGPGGNITQSAPCVGLKRIVPDYLSIAPEVGEVAPFAGALHNLCDRKEVTLDNLMQANADFFIYTMTPKSTSFTGFISDDFSSEFDPASPAFGEKFAIPNVPVSIKDFDGVEISRIYSDQWGIFNGVVYSTWEVDPPNPTGYGPNMMITCMNDPGPIPDPNHPGQVMNDPYYNPAYSTFCYENPFMPGDTTYLDTPVVPVSAFAEGYNPPDCAYPDGTPMILSVQGDVIGTGNASARGPWVSLAGHSITINALAPSNSAGIQVPNNSYSGPAATTAPFNQKYVTRHYGFGSAVGTVTIGGATASCGTWADDHLVCTVPSTVPSCPLLQTNASSGVKISAQCGELVITTGGPNPKQSIDTVTVTIAGGTPTFVAGEDSTGHAIQKAIDTAKSGDLIIVGCAGQVGTPGTAGFKPAQTSCTYNEMLLMWKPVRLQGIGDGAVTINANTHPAGKMLEPWRRQVNCLFGLSINGGFISQGNPYDPNNQFTCANQSGPPNTTVDAIVGEPIVGWDATLNGNLAELLQEPTLMGAYEGAGITVLAKGLENGGTSTCTVENAAGCIPLNSSTATGGDCNRFSAFYPSNYLCNPSRVDGLTFTNSSQGGGGVFLHGFNHNTEVSNLNVTSNGGTLTGGITIGQMETVDPTTATVGGRTVAQAMGYNQNVNVHNNRITSNAAYGDELNSNTPSSAGGVTLCTGADNYKFQYNWVCGNWSSGDGGGVAHHGFTWNGLIANNWILFNESTNPSLVTNGGGLIVLGAKPDGPLGEECVTANGGLCDVDVAPDLTHGTGPNLVIKNNVFQGNIAEQGQGGGIALLNVNGNDVANNPSSPGNSVNSNGNCTHDNGSGWYCVSITDNIIANNVAGWDGGGVSLVDAILVDFHGNTVVSNDSTATAGVVFNANGAPLGNVPPPGCNPQNFGCTGPFPTFTQSHPLAAGLVTEVHSTLLGTALATFRGNSTPCPTGHTTTGTAGGHPGNKACAWYSVPFLNSDIFWQNRSFSIGTSPTVNARNSVVLLPTLSQASTGSCPSGASYWDIGVYNDSGPGDHASGLTLSTGNSILTGGTNPGFPHLYCNGARVPPEIAPTLCTSPTNAPGCTYAGAVGIQTNGGVPDSAVPPNPLFSITTAATIDEGSNWINMFYGPLSSICQITTTTGAAGTCGTGTGSVPYNGPLGNYTSTTPQGAKSFPQQGNQVIYPNP